MRYVEFKATEGTLSAGSHVQKWACTAVEKVKLRKQIAYGSMMATV